MATGDTVTGTGVEERRAERIGPGVIARGVGSLIGDGDLSKRLLEEVCTKQRRLSMWIMPKQPPEPTGAGTELPGIKIAGGGGGVAARDLLPWQGPTHSEAEAARGDGAADHCWLPSTNCCRRGDGAVDQLRGGVRNCGGVACPKPSRGVSCLTSSIDVGAATRIWLADVKKVGADICTGPGGTITRTS